MKSKDNYFTRNKWSFAVGGIGRDMSYTLMSAFLIMYIQYTMNLTVAQFSAISVILVIGRIWDGINDPMMGAIIENTRSKLGKFRPWILAGGVGTAIVIIMLFSIRLFTGWDFVIFFAIAYFVWEIVFTMNDIAYWSLLPNLSSDKKKRDNLTTLAIVFAGIGGCVGNVMLSLSAGDAVDFYRNNAIIIAIALVVCTCLTFFGVKQGPVSANEDNEKAGIKEMFKIIKNNDQLLWNTLAFLMYCIGTGLFGGLAYNMMYMELGYKGFFGMIYIAVSAIVNLIAQFFYPYVANKFKRSTIITVSIITLSVGYAMFLLVGYVPFLPMSIITICVCGVFVCIGQAFFYIALFVNFSNTIEYNEYKTGKRNEGIIFSLRPFMSKLGNAISTAAVSLILILTGVYALSQNVTVLETQKSYFDSLNKSNQQAYIFQIEAYDAFGLMTIELPEDYAELTEADYEILTNATYEYNEENDIYSMIIADTSWSLELEGDFAADRVFKDQADGTLKFFYRLAVTVLPVLLMAAAGIVLSKKFKITEEEYTRITKAIAQKKK